MNELLVGIDWSQSHYDIAVVAPNGALLTQFRIAKTAAGILPASPRKSTSLGSRRPTVRLVWKRPTIS